MSNPKPKNKSSVTVKFWTDLSVITELCWESLSFVLGPLVWKFGCHERKKKTKQHDAKMIRPTRQVCSIEYREFAPSHQGCQWITAKQEFVTIIMLVLWNKAAMLLLSAWKGSGSMYSPSWQSLFLDPLLELALSYPISNVYYTIQFWHSNLMLYLLGFIIHFIYRKWMSYVSCQCMY